MWMRALIVLALMLFVAGWFGAMLVGMSFFSRSLPGAPTPAGWGRTTVRVVLALAVAGAGLIFAERQALPGRLRLAAAFAGILIALAVEALWRAYDRRHGPPARGGSP